MNWTDETLEKLRKFVGYARIGIITDMDGTISPIVNEPDAARVTPRSVELLAALQKKLALVAVVSGRAAADIQGRLGLADVVYIGNHGFEQWDGQQAVPLLPEATQFRQAMEALQSDLTLTEGMMLEDKGLTLSLHYRQTADPSQVAADYKPVLQTLADRHGLRLYQGRMVFELRPPLDIHKGTAFEYLVKQYQLESAMYIGDDTTDVDAMRAARQMRASGVGYGLAVGVIAEETPPAVRENADIQVHGIQEVEILLDWLLRVVSAS